MTYWCCLPHGRRLGVSWAWCLQCLPSLGGVVALVSWSGLPLADGFLDTPCSGILGQLCSPLGLVWLILLRLFGEVLIRSSVVFFFPYYQRKERPP